MTLNLLSEPSLAGGISMWPLLIAAILVVVLVWFAIQRGLFRRPVAANAATSSPTTADPSGSMPKYQVRIIIWYLILLGALLVYMEIALLSVDFPVMMPIAPTPAVTTAAAEPQPTAEPQESPAEGAPAPTNPAPTQTPTPIPAPKIEAVIPQSSLGVAPDLWITIWGSNFPKNGRVRLNGVRQAVPEKASTELMIAKFAASDFLGKGTLIVDVIGPDNQPSNSVIIPIDKPTALLNVLGIWKPPIHRELQLLLVVVCAGALGTFIHTMKSAQAFIGNGTMKRSWYWWYITAPWVGAAMALIFYAVLRGGFLIGAPADEKFVSPFGVLVIGALVGMFSDKASLKLKEIFDTIFKADGDPRGGKLHAPAIHSLDPSTVQAGSTQEVKVLGERLGKVTAIRFNSTELPVQIVSDREVRFTLKPEHIAKAGTLQIVVVDPENGTSVSATLTVSEAGAATGPSITAPDTLPAATQATAYDQALTATGGTEPYAWSISSGTLPAGLSLDATGHLTGTPTETGTFPITVTVTDANTQSGEKAYELVVN